MGRLIDHEDFTDQDYRRFEARLHESLDALEQLLARPGFGVGPSTMGAELELHLVDAAARPYAINRTVLDAVRDERVTLEIAKYNVEVNTRPAALSDHAFRHLGSELDELLGRVRSAAALYGARTVPIGILPTLERADLENDMLTDASRYRALANGICARRRGSRVVHIEGRAAQSVDFSTDGIALAGANTSFQIQLRVAPEDFARVYNAAQLATAPALAVSGNSPFFLGESLWDETRIALFPQGFDPRAADEAWRVPRVSFGNAWCETGIVELFRDSVTHHAPLLPVVGLESPLATVARGGVPGLDELRLHQGTVWRWNRAVYDPAEGGHVRVEMRALPAGPTVLDMVANAAFIVGLTLGTAHGIEALTARIPFEHARRNFLDSAKYGLDADLLWPDASNGAPCAENARSLVLRLLPVAQRGLAAAGVPDEDAEALLEIIGARASSRQTGAAWQRRLHDAHSPHEDRRGALHALLQTYLSLSQEGRPVHEWRL